MYDLRCHRCSHWIGEAADPVEFVGLFKKPRDRSEIAGPRSAWKCSSCGWTNVFKRAVTNWREVEVKV